MNMAQLYNDREDILFLNPSLPKNYFRGKIETKCILIPMKRFKVLVPYPKDSALNLFQETVLKLLQSGAKEAKWLSEMMSLDKALIDVILEELRTRKYITKNRMITEAGRAILANEISTYEMKTGYIFYNYLTNTYMDVFLSDDKTYAAGIRKRIPEENRVQFFLDDSVENSRYENGIIIRANKPDADVKPSPYDIMGVCKRQKNRARMLFSGDYKEAKENMNLLPRNIEKVKLLDENADVYVATYLAIPINDLVNKSNIQVCYPFGEGLANSMLSHIIRAAKCEENQPLANTIDALKSLQTQLSVEEKEAARRISPETVSRVNSILSENVGNHPYLYEMALDVEDRRGKIIQLISKNKGSNWETINGEINKYIISNYGLMASILIDCASKNEYYDDSSLNQYLAHNAQCLSTVAGKCGFTDENEIFSRFFRIKKSHLATAKQVEELNALIALNLLEADSNVDHPFYALGENLPDFITKAYLLKALRSDGMHGNDIEYNFMQVEELSKYNFRVASTIFDDLTFESSKMEIGQNFEINEVQIKIRKEAENQVEKKFTENIYKYSGLSNLLVQMVEEEIREGNSYPSRVAAVLEFILKELCKRRIVSSTVSEVRAFDPEYGKELKKDMQNFGFSISRVPYFNNISITKSFRNYRMGTLGSNFYVWYLSECQQPDCMLNELGNKCPNFIKLVDDTIQTREHKGKMVFSDSRLNFLKNNIVETINGIVDLMIYRGIY